MLNVGQDIKKELRIMEVNLAEIKKENKKLTN
jgi:hypothetical protein